jgi:benzodiazapine receptor
MAKIDPAGIAKLLFSIIACEFAGFIGSLFTTPSIPTWYASLNKPSFNPPNWLFAPVWTTLYAFMGVSLFLVWSKGLNNRRVKLALVVFIVQLILNVLWSMVFFGLRSLVGGEVVIGVLWITILFTVMRCLKVSKIAGLLLIPYIVWTSFAAILNTAILILNS